MTSLWLACEPVGDDVVWALSSPAGVVDGGFVESLGALRTDILDAVPGAGGVSLWDGPWNDRGREPELARRAGAALLPTVLRELLGPSSTVTIAVRGWLASVPWDVLVVDPERGTRLLERARVLGGLPPTVESGRPVTASHGRRAVRVVDPGPSSVGRIHLETPEWWWDRCSDEEDVLPLPGATMGSEELGDALRRDDPDRLVYFGHAVGGTPQAPASAGLVLTGRDGRPEVFTAHRWLSESERFPSPARVAIVACGSDDGHYIEQSGLPVAAVHAGARTVTATRWALPVEPSLGGRCPTTALGLAVDAALASQDSIGALRAWQIDRLRAWRTGGNRADSPLLWGSLVTYRPTGRTP